MRSVSFDFADQRVPSLADVIRVIATHDGVPAKRRAAIRSSLTMLAKWTGQDPTVIPFVPPLIEAAFESLQPNVIGISGKRLKNARADARFALTLAGGPWLYHTPFSPEAQRLWDLLEGKYLRCSLSRLLRYLSAHRIDPACITDRISQAFLEALRREGRLRLKAETIHQSAIRTWNRAVATYPAWPQVILTVPCYRRRSALPWSAFPKSLERDVDRFLASGEALDNLFDGPTHQPLKETTRRTQNTHLRRAASALVAAGIAIETLGCLRSLCEPARFRLALDRIVRDRKGHIGGYVAGLAWTLVKLARFSGELADHEVAEVNKCYKSLSIHRQGELRGEDRDDEAIRLLDDSRRFDALLTLPSWTVERVRKLKTINRAAALEIQKACALEIWFCVPLRISNFVSLRLDQHFFPITIHGQKRVMVRIPAYEVKNVEALEFILSEDAAALLNLYISKYRPFLKAKSTPWLFPGYGDRHKLANALRVQMKRYVNDATGIGFYPHLIRRIYAKIYMDADPAGIEIVRRGLGHRDARTTRRFYVQQQNRAARLKYLEALESRKLAALRQALLR
jgi:integrase